MLCTRLSVRIRTSCILFFRVHTRGYKYIPGLSLYIPVCTWFMTVHTFQELYVTGLFKYIPVCIRYLSVHTLQWLYKPGLYQYKVVCTRFGSVHKVPVKVPVTSTGTLCTDGRVSGTLPLFSGNGMNKYVLSSDYDNTVPLSYIPCYSMVPL
jgi:hypothetical protein